jgi:DNA-binding transcriptional LysR family regulator
MLSGATGQLYGSKYTWPFPDGWKTHLNTPGSLQAGYLGRFFRARPWWRLVPDTPHRGLTAGYGTFADGGSVDSSDYATAAATADGGLAIAYLPTRRTVTLDLRRFRGRVNARWFDPTRGTYRAISGSPFARTGSLRLTPPRRNGEGEDDWVLVLSA